MIVNAACTPQPSQSASNAGALLRHWRSVRRLSQLELALEAGVSSRHVSYLETGRSQPSREMLLRLAEALAIPLRDRNALFVSAGYAPRYFENALSAPELAPVRRAIDLILQHQEPFPAFLLDRYWDIRMANRAAERCTRFLLDADPREANMLRLILAPDGVRPLMIDWEATAGALIRHLHQQLSWTPSDERLRALLAEVLGHPDVPARWSHRDFNEAASPLLTTSFRKGDVELRFFSTLTTFGTPHDMTLEELRIECSFPADEATAAACERLFAD